MKDIETQAIEFLKQFEDTDVWEQSELVEYVLQKAIEFDLVKNNNDDETDKSMFKLFNALYSAIDMPENDYIVNRYFKYDNRKFQFFIRDYKDNRFKTPVQLLVFLERDENNMAGSYFYRKIIKHNPGLPEEGISSYDNEIEEAFWNLITTDLYKTNLKLEKDLNIKETEYILDKLS